MKYSKLFKFLFFLYLIILFLLMVMTIKTDQIGVPSFIFGIAIDKVVHFTLFFPYPLLIWLAFNEYFIKVFKNLTILIIGISGFVLAFVAEYMQSFNPYRNFDLYDILANIIAIIAGTLILALIRYLIKLLK